MMTTVSALLLRLDRKIQERKKKGPPQKLRERLGHTSLVRFVRGSATEKAPRRPPPSELQSHSLFLWSHLLQLDVAKKDTAIRDKDDGLSAHLPCCHSSEASLGRQTYSAPSLKQPAKGGLGCNRCLFLRGLSECPRAREGGGAKQIQQP